VKNYYSTLGVDKNSTPDQIKQAYRRLASQHHPDKGGDTAQFQEIQEAYAILSDVDKRQQYDNPQPQHNSGFGAANFDFDTIFNIFGADLRGQRKSPPRMELWISLEDVATGGSRTAGLNINNVTSNVELNIPPGIQNGDSVRYPGLAPGGQDLIITYRIKPHPQWQSDGINIIKEHVIDIWDLILGYNLTVKDLSGNELILTVPPETQPDTILRARGRGLPARQMQGDRIQNQKGDLMIKLKGKINGPIDKEIIESIRKSRV
jgi:DnaJ-class molecular chaperone